MLKNDRCVMTIGFYEAHFTAYQPDSRGDEEFCEDLPDLGRVVFVLDYLHRSLAEVPVDFRIIRDPTGLGRFAQLADLEGVDIPALTVFYQPPVVRSDASLQLSYRFAEPGAYIGIVTAGHPTKDKFYSSVFPFSVGVGGPSYLWIVGAVGALLVAGGGVWLLRRPAAGRPGVVV
jgi:hypothetical protein